MAGCGPLLKNFVKRNPIISRTLEIRGDQTLEELHRAIFKAFDRTEEHMYEFQVGGKGPKDPKTQRLSAMFCQQNLTMRLKSSRWKGIQKTRPLVP